MPTVDDNIRAYISGRLACNMSWALRLLGCTRSCMTICVRRRLVTAEPTVLQSLLRSRPVLLPQKKGLCKFVKVGVYLLNPSQLCLYQMISSRSHICNAGDTYYQSTKVIFKLQTLRSEHLPYASFQEVPKVSTNNQSCVYRTLFYQRRQ